MEDFLALLLLPTLGYLLGGQLPVSNSTTATVVLPPGAGPVLFNETAGAVVNDAVFIVDEPVVILIPPPPVAPNVTENIPVDPVDPMSTDAPIHIIPWTVHVFNAVGLSLILVWVLCLWYRLRFERAERRRAELRRLHGPSIVKGEMPHYYVFGIQPNPDQPEYNPCPDWLVRATPELERRGSAPLVAKDPKARPSHEARAEFVRVRNDRHLAPQRVVGETRPVKRPAVLQANCLDQCLYRLCCAVTSWTGTRVLFVLTVSSFAVARMEIRTKRTVVVEESGWDYWGDYFKGKAYDIAIAGLLKLFYEYFMSIVAVGTFGATLAVIPCCWCCRTARQQSRQLDEIQQQQAAAAAAARPARIPSYEEQKEMAWRDNRFKRFLSIEEHDRLATIKSAVTGVKLDRAKSMKAIGKVEAARVATVQKAFGRKLGRPSVVLNEGHLPGAHKKKDVRRPLIARINTWVREKVSGKRYDPRLATAKEEMRLVPPAPIEVEGPDPVPERGLVDASAPSQYERVED